MLVLFDMPLTTMHFSGQGDASAKRARSKRCRKSRLESHMSRNQRLVCSSAGSGSLCWVGVPAADRVAGKFFPGWHQPMRVHTKVVSLFWLTVLHWRSPANFAMA